MSTAFFWSRDGKDFICERKGIGLEHRDFNKTLTYVFRDVKDIIKLFRAERDRVIYDEYGAPLTVNSLIAEIVEKGCIIIVPDYFEEPDSGE